MISHDTLRRYAESSVSVNMPLRQSDWLPPVSTMWKIPTNARCVYCDRRASEWDHVRPRSKGGNSRDNIVPCCRRCNSRKSNNLLTEWADPVRVRYGIAASRIVAAEWFRLTGDYPEYAAHHRTRSE